MTTPPISAASALNPLITPSIVLGSSSRYRKSLLERLNMPFAIDVPDIDETAQVNEAPIALAKRLALQKAQRVAERHPTSWVIGSDQVAVCNGRIYGKPEVHDKAVVMLNELSGQALSFHTALCVFDSAHNRFQLDVVTIEAKFRHLGSNEIEHYLRIEQPYDCAASARSEGLGITLLEYMRGDDDTALIGLPLIRLCSMFREWGLFLPMASHKNQNQNSAT